MARVFGSSLLVATLLAMHVNRQPRKGISFTDELTGEQFLLPFPEVTEAAPRTLSDDGWRKRQKKQRLHRR